MYFSDEPFTCHDGANCKDLGSRGPGGNGDIYGGGSTTIGTIGGDIYGGGYGDGYGDGYGG